MSELLEGLAEIKRQKDNYIIPENIKKDVTIFNVTGSYDGSGGSNSVKLFDTIEHMQEDETAQPGDLAVVYNNSLINWEETTQFNKIIFPLEVTLPEVVTEEYYASFEAVITSYTFQGSVNLNSSRFEFTIYDDNMNESIVYASSDGIHYIRTNGSDIIELDYNIKCSYEWNDLIGYFLQIDKSEFNGLFLYDEYNDKTKIAAYQNLVVDSSGNYTYDNLIPIDTSVIFNLLDVVKSDLHISSSLAGVLVKNENSYSLYYYQTSDTYGYMYGKQVILCTEYDNNNNLCVASAQKTDDTSRSFYRVDINLDGTYTKTQLSRGTAIRKINDLWYIYKYDDIGSKPIFSLYEDNGSNISFNALKFYLSNSKTIDLNIPTINYKYFGYELAKNQLLANNEDVYEKSFYGVNGSELGTLGNTVLNTFNDNPAAISAKAQCVYENLEPIVFTSSYDFDTLNKDIYYIPAKLDGTSLIDTSNVNSMRGVFNGFSKLITTSILDTSNVTDMSYMFTNCINLVSIPNFNTSKVTTMHRMFYGCSNLSSLPNFDTMNVTNTQWMFRTCTNLVTIPNFNTSNITTMSYMFCECYNLVNIPQFNTDKVTIMYGLFETCRNLVNLPLLNTRNVTNMEAIVYGCSNLSNASLNNLLSMCATSAVTTNKTLKKLGLSQDQALICQNLSNWSACNSAGWKSGY